MKNITKYTRDNYGFDGYRFSITRKGVTFCRYFPTISYGSFDRALRHALALKHELMQLLDNPKADEALILSKYKNKYKNSPNHKHSTLPQHLPKSCTIHLSPPMQQWLHLTSHHLNISPATLLSLALYHLFTHLANPTDPLSLPLISFDQLITHAESQRHPLSPSWKIFSNSPPPSK